MKNLLILSLVISVLAIMPSYASVESGSGDNEDPAGAVVTEFSLSDETIIIAQMISDPEVKKCIEQIETEYKGHFHIWKVIRRPLNPDAIFEDGSAALAVNSTYFFRGSIGNGGSYKGPDAIAVNKVRVKGREFSQYVCRIVDQIYK